MKSNWIGARIQIKGIVQGVGFRPFVYRLAHELDLHGWVRNTSACVEIQVDGTQNTITSFLQRLQHDAPPLAHIDSIESVEGEPDGFVRFEILKSEVIPDAFQPISPDVSVCVDCIRELFDPNDRRYRYPFINCTNCGPRFTIIQDIPYDRPKTTMAPFPMCPDCANEYNDPSDRRYHAQPVACPKCGPDVWLEMPDRLTDPAAGASAIQQTRELLKDGKIVAVKGLGGFHLACDALNPIAVQELRSRKLRVEKPFAVMIANQENVKKYCKISEDELELLQSHPHPIVILERLDVCRIASEVTPGKNDLGVMLPYTPLHFLLMEPDPEFPEALVMTSGNMSEEPLVVTNHDARTQLKSLADAFLMHNREIQNRCDDSVVRVQPMKIMGRTESPVPSSVQIRRSRGYAPNPVSLPWSSPQILAAGPELKNTFCLTKDRYAFLSQYIGDLTNFETLGFYQDNMDYFEKIFRIKPELIAYDLHPDYLSTQAAIRRGTEEKIPAIAIQHHHAHIASCMTEHGLTSHDEVIGVAFDGTGYGTDGRIWGGEFLVGSYQTFQRVVHLEYFPMPGGEKAIQEPWRLALACLKQYEIEWVEDLPPMMHAMADAKTGPSGLAIVEHQIDQLIHAPLTSSMGRLFDAVSALIGVRQKISYEGQAAIELEAVAAGGENTHYPFEFSNGVIHPTQIVHSILKDMRENNPVPVISARFHNTISKMVHDICCSLRRSYHLNRVILSGGVWQNMVLLKRAHARLSASGFDVYTHQRVPTNDGGVSLGQAAIAHHLTHRGESLDEAVIKNRELDH